jgi:hypothetical protein
MIAESQDPDQRFLCNRLLGSPESRHSLLTAEFICTINQARFHTICQKYAAGSSGPCLTVQADTPYLRCLRAFHAANWPSAACSIRSSSPGASVRAVISSRIPFGSKK